MKSTIINYFIGCILLILPLSTFCQQKDVILKIRVKDLKIPSTMYYHSINTDDLARSNNGEFEFNEIIDSDNVAQYIIKYPGKKRVIDHGFVYLQAGLTEITISSPDSDFKAEIKGPKLTVDYQEKLSAPVNYYKQQQSINEGLYKLAKIHNQSDTSWFKAKIQQAEFNCFNAPQVYIKGNPNSPLSIIALEMLGNGSKDTPVSVYDLSNLFNSLTDNIKSSSEGQKYAAKLREFQGENNFGVAKAIGFDANYKLLGTGRVQSKNFYLLTLLSQNKQVKQIIEKDSVFVDLTKQKIKQIEEAIKDSLTVKALTRSLTFSGSEHAIINKRLGELYDSSDVLRELVSKELVPSGCYILNKGFSPKEQLIKAWEEEGSGINYTIAVYGGGRKPNYPDIDSISFKVNDPAYLQQVKQVAAHVLTETKQSNLFFLPSMTAALLFLDQNGRNDAGDFEPLEKTVNKAALARVPDIEWSKFAYSVLVVPGAGPETYAEAISPDGKIRCQLAAKAYNQGVAPFIMLSGGKVHPYKTKFCEAAEMKKYLVDSLAIPANAVIMEPQARHTTTNMRNCVRLMIRYHFPIAKPGLVVSDKADVDYITGMADRCLAELKEVPYLLGNRVADDRLEFYPVADALHVNPYEPLDP